MYKLALSAENLKYKFCLVGVFGFFGYSAVVAPTAWVFGACVCSLLDASPPAENNISHQVLWFFHLELKCQSL